LLPVAPTILLVHESPVSDHEDEDETFGVADLIYRPVVARPDPVDVLVELFRQSGGTRISGEEFEVVGNSPLVGLWEQFERLRCLPANLYPIGLVS
jgi:hypothetical protein